MKTLSGSSRVIQVGLRYILLYSYHLDNLQSIFAETYLTLLSTMACCVQVVFCVAPLLQKKSIPQTEGHHKANVKGAKPFTSAVWWKMKKG